jgi:heme/copper-type cytochrome/quinol oxidase subunit 3
MKTIKAVEDVSLFILVVINLLFLAVTVPYGGIIKGVFYYTLTDRPEFSHIGDSQIEAINIISTILVVGGTVLPLGIVFLSKLTMKQKRTWIAFASLLPITFLLTKLLIFPEPDSFKETSMGAYQFRKYEWGPEGDKKVKCWISEKPLNAYTNKERVKWLPYAEPVNSN